MHLPWSYLTTWLSRHHLGAFGISAPPPWPQATILPICKLCYLQWTFALHSTCKHTQTQKQSHIHVMPDIHNMLNKNVLVGFWCKKCYYKSWKLPDHSKVIKMPLDPQLWSYLDPSQTARACLWSAPSLADLVLNMSTCGGGWSSRQHVQCALCIKSTALHCPMCSGHTTIALYPKSKNQSPMDFFKVIFPIFL